MRVKRHENTKIFAYERYPMNKHPERLFPLPVSGRSGNCLRYRRLLAQGPATAFAITRTDRHKATDAGVIRQRHDAPSPANSVTRNMKMRTLLLTIVPAIALMAAPAFAQSSSASETTTVTTAPAPVPAQTTTQKVYKTEAGPDGQDMEAKSKTVTTDAYGNKTAEKMEHQEQTNDDGSHSESSSRTTTSGPN
jgi:hypothetical protein